jgi:3-keto-disaccharide hydrolase
MRTRARGVKIVVCLVSATMLFGVSSYAAKELRKYRVHDKTRPHPPVVTPAAQFGQPPSDAIILFDGKDTSQWVSEKGDGPVKWIVKDGYMQIVPKTGGIRTKKAFQNCQLHIEWCTPEGVDPKITDQKRSNSGVFLMDRYEVQVLDSYTDDNYKTNHTYADGQAAAIYGQHPPIVNACRKPGQWQSYDISFLRPLFDADGNVVRKGRITLFHNGVVVHNNLDIEGTTFHGKKAAYSPHESGSIHLQDHGNPIRFRNIWIRELPEEPYLTK